MSGLTKATLLLADDHPIFINGLVVALKDEFTILGCAASGQGLISLLKIKEPQAILMDLQMPGTNALNTIREIAIRYPQIKLITLTDCYEAITETQLKLMGVNACLKKDTGGGFLIHAVKMVLAGITVSCKPGQEIRSGEFSSPAGQLIDRHKLSSRELEVVSLIRKGLTSNEIANSLFISINTVEAHRKNIFKKLNLRNIQGLVEFAFRYSL